MATAWVGKRRRLLIALLALGVGIVGCEGILRWLMFSDSALAQRFGASFRDAGLYMPSVQSDEYHKLRYLLMPPARRAQARVPCPELGWISSEIDPATLRHVDEARIGERRPVLLYGSSYAACYEDGMVCMQELLERSPLAQDHCLINYAVLAYGPDQSTLLASRTLPRMAERRPVAVLQLLADVDLSRTVVSFFNAPKPRYHKEAGAFSLVVPDELDPMGFIERHPLDITSYLGRYLAHGVGLRQESARVYRQQRREWMELSLFCIDGFHAEAEALGIEHFVLLFQSPNVVAPLGKADRDELALVKHFRAEAIPFVSARPLLEACAAREGNLDAYFIQAPPNSYHPNDRGKQILLEALTRGLARRFD